MKGLLYKDCVTLLRQMKFYLLLIAVFALIPGYSLSAFALVYAAVLPFSSIAYDEQSKWNRLAVMMPYTDGQLVLSKYLLGWAGVLCAALLSAAGQIAGCLVRGATTELASFPQSMLTLVAAALILQAIALPLLFRLGAERGRMTFMLTIVVGAIALMVGNTMIPTIPDLSEGAIRWAICAATILAIGGNAASVRLSQKFFRRGMRV